MKRYFAICTLLLVSAFCFMSCEEDNDPTTVCIDVLLKFQSKSGANLADSLNLCGSDDYVDLRWEGDKKTSINVVRESDGKELLHPETGRGWMKLDNVNNWVPNDYPILDIYGAETILFVGHSDLNVSPYGVRGYKDAVIFNIKNDLLFNDPDFHTLKVHYVVYEHNEWEITKCEFDGEDVTDPSMFGIRFKSGYRASTVALKLVL